MKSHSGSRGSLREFTEMLKSQLGVFHLLCTQNFPKSKEFLPPDKETCVCVSGS